MSTETNNATPEVQASAKAQVKHTYYEIESDLLAKPNALVDIVLTTKVPTVVFCNMPSEADMVDAMLKKRGVTSLKLIGHVPPAKVLQAVQKVTSGEAQVLIVTDVSAREINIGAFGLLINYAIHEEPEVYLHRFEHSAEGSKMEKVVSLISPLDHGNFHYLKKVVDFQIDKADMPDNTEILKAQLEQVIKEAEGFSYPENQKFEQLLALATAATGREALFKYMLYHTLYVMPELKMKNSAAANTGGGHYENNRYEDRGGERSNDRGGERGGYQRRGYDRGGERGGYDRGERSNDRGGERGGYDRGDMPQRQEIPKQEFVRFYVGQGKNDNLSRAELEQLLTSAANMPASHIARYIERPNYAFIDVLKENASGLDEIMNGYKLSNGQSLLFKKATSIVAPIPGSETPQAAATEEGAAGSEDQDNNGNS